MTQRAWLSTCLGLALSLPTAAHAQIDFEELPRGDLRPSPDEAPRRVPGSQRADGLYPHREGMGGSDRGFLVRVLSSRPPGGVFSPMRAMFGEPDGPPDRTCVTTRNAIDGDSVINPWQLHFGWAEVVHVDPRMHKGRKAIFAVHAEKLVEDDGEHDARLEVTDAWLDVRTLGLREAARYELPLREVAQGPAGLRIYAARDRERVHFVVQPPDQPALPEDASQFAQPRTRALQVVAGNQPNGNTACGHVRVTLTTEVAGGESAVVRAFVVSTDGSEQQDAAPEATPSAEILGLRARRSAAPSVELLIRPLNIQLSVSRTSSDEAPMPTVGLGWAGPATHVQL